MATPFITLENTEVRVTCRRSVINSVRNRDICGPLGTWEMDIQVDDGKYYSRHMDL